MKTDKYTTNKYNNIINYMNNYHFPRRYCRMNFNRMTNKNNRWKIKR